MDKFYLRALRLAAKSKLTDRWIHSQWYQPLDAEDAGTTFTLIEVVNPWFPSPQITTTITNTFNREYFRARRVGSAADAFETAVRRVNEALALRADEGETDWIGSLHSTLAVIADGELHLSRAGRAQTLIVRGSSANPVVPNRTIDDSPPPQQTFSSIVAGSLLPGDKGVFATPDFFDHVPLADFVTALGKPLEQGALDVVRILQQKKTKTPHAVLFDYSEAPHAERATSEAETIYIDQPLERGLTRVRHVATGVVLPALATGAKATGSAAGWFWGKARSDLFPKLRMGQPTKQAQEAAVAGEESPPLSTPKREDSQLPPSSQPTKARPTAARLLSPFAAFLNRLSAFASAIRLRSRPLFIGVLVVIVVAVGLRFLNVRRSQGVLVAKSTAQEALSIAQSKKQEADLALIYNETDRALTLYMEALSLAKKAAGHPDLAEAADEVSAGAQAALDDLTKTKRVGSISPVAHFSSPSNFRIAVGKIWSIDQDGTVSFVPLAGGEVTRGQTISGLGRLVGLAEVNEQGTLFVVGESGVGTVRTADGSAATVAAPTGGWAKAAAVESYGTTLYFLDPSTGQIWKYPTTVDGIPDAQPTKYFADEATPAQAVDLAIDGSIYVLERNGTIVEYLRGEKQDFTITGLPKPYETWKEPRFIATTRESRFVYVYEQTDRRIVELDKTGQYVRQFALPEDWSVKDIQLVQTDTLWVLSGDAAYLISL